MIITGMDLNFIGVLFSRKFKFSRKITRPDLHRFSKEEAAPNTIPPALPYSPVAKAIPRQVVKPVMARMSSKLPAAMSSVGMPCSRP